MELSLAQLQAALAPTTGNVWPSVENRAAWENVAATPYGASVHETSTKAANDWLARPLVLPSFTDYLQIDRTGSRTEWEQKASALAARLSSLTLAACFTADEKYIDGALDAWWAISEMWTWVMPAHQNHETASSPGFDLGTASRAIETALAWQLLGSRWSQFHSRIEPKFRATLDNRVFEPYLSRDDYVWLRPSEKHPRLNNWTAVCSGSALVCALDTLDDQPEKQARVVERAIESLSHFLATFGESGSLDEGVGYWSYGFSHYVIAAERLFARTNGAVDLLADPLWREVALFPIRVNLHNDNYVNFSDCASRVVPPFGWIAWMGKHLDSPELGAWAARLQKDAVASSEAAFLRHNGLTHTLRNLFWSDPTEQQPAERPLSTYLPDVEWLVVRSTPEDNALVMAIKGGHNDENHNHNDVGSFIVHWNGEAFVDEVGAPTYTRQFFSGNRYENIAARSLGHSVPFVNGCEQVVGREYSSTILHRDASSFLLEFAAAYPEAAHLRSLRRNARLENETVIIEDAAEFDIDDATFATQLITRHCTIEIFDDEAIIRGKRGEMRVTWSRAQAVAHTERIETDDARFLDENGNSQLARLWFDVAVQNRFAALRLEIAPLQGTVDFDRT